MTGNSVSTLTTSQAADSQDQQGPAVGPWLARLFWPMLASAIALTIGAWSLTRLSPTIDEWAYVQFGVKFWFSGDSDWLIRAGVLPLPFWIQSAPGALYLRLKHGSLPGGLGGNFGLSLTLPDQLLVLHLARWTNLILTGLGTIWLVWLLTHRLFGRVAANIAALFFAVEPNLLAGYILGTGDAAIVPPCLLMMIVYENHLRRPRVWNLLVIAVLYGLGIGFKISTVPTGLLVVWACVLARLVQQLGEPGPVVAKAQQNPARVGSVRPACHAVSGDRSSLSWAANGFLWDHLLNPDSPNQVAYKIVGKMGYRGESATAWVEKLQRTMVPAPIGVLRR